MYALRAALAERHGVAFEEVVVGAGADGVIDLLSPGDARARRRDRLRLAVVPELRARRREARARWRARCRSATTRTTSTRCSPRSARARSSSTSAIRTTRPARRTAATSCSPSSTASPSTCSTVVDQAYFEYIDDPDYPDAIAELLPRGAGASSSCARSRRSTASPGCASATASRRRTSSPRRARCGARSTSRRPAQAAALASIGDDGGARAPARARTPRAVAQLEAALREHGLEPAGPGGRQLPLRRGRRRAPRVFERLLRAGRDRAPARRLRRARGDPRHGRHRRRERLLRRRARTGPFERLVTASIALLTSQAALTAVSRQQLAPLRNAGFRLLVPRHPRVEHRHAPRCDRARGRRQGPDELRALGRRACSSSTFLPTVFVGLTLGPLSTGCGGGSSWSAPTSSAPRSSARCRSRRSAGEIVALAAVAGLANGFFRPAVYAGVPNLVAGGAAARGERRSCRRSRTSSWAIGPILGGHADRRRRPARGVLDQRAPRSSSPPRSSSGSRRGCCRARRRSRAGTGRDLKDGFAAVLRSRALLAVLLAWGIASLGVGAVNVVRDLPREEHVPRRRLRLRAAVGAIGVGLVLGSLAEQPGRSSGSGSARTYAAVARGDGGRVRRRGGQPERLGGGRRAASSAASATAPRSSCNALLVQQRDDRRACAAARSRS